MDFTRQQMCGHKDFSMRTLTGNWSEDIARESDRMKEYMSRKSRGELDSQKIQRKMDNHLTQLTLTPQHSDGFVRFGDVLMVQSALTKGFISLDIDRKTPGRDGHFQVTVAPSKVPVLRNAWIIMKAKDENMGFYKKHREADILHFGQKVRIVNQYLFSSHLSLCASQGPQACLKGNTLGQSRGEVTACVAGGIDAIWKVQPSDSTWRMEEEGKPVRAGETVALVPIRTNLPLSCEASTVTTNFGREHEVSSFLHKGQFNKHDTLPLEVGNVWALVCAPAGSHFVPYTPAEEITALERVRQKLLQRGGGLGFRGLVRTLRIMDDDGNRQLTRREFKNGLEAYGVHLTVGEMDVVFKEFDRDGNGSITITEFLRTLRGEMNNRRKNLALMAYDRLDKDLNGTVTFDEITRIYGKGLSEHPAVKAGSKTEEEVLMEFISCWDKSGDGIITRREFLEYYNDVSANIDNDDYFELMIRNAWHMSGGEGWCENTSCRRVLVIHTDGRQTIEEIKDDLGIGPEDTDKMIENLRAQGINDIKQIKLHF